MSSSIAKLMAQRTEGHRTDGLSVMVIDEDKHHTDSARSMLCKLNFYVTVYSSPREALQFLENHAQDVDFVLAAVHMEELSGFQFLQVAREVHKNLQVIMMSTETTMYTVKRCVELGARFLVKKPLVAETMNNIWQHLDLKVLRMEKVKHLFRGIGDETYDGQDTGNCTIHQKDGTKKRTFLFWTPYLQRKFLHALKTLGEDAQPKEIAMIMNGVDPKHIASHQQMQSFAGDTQGGDVYTAMRRALQHGTVFDESQYSNDEANEAGEDVMGGDGGADEADGSNSSDDDQVVAETYNAGAAQESTSNSDVKVSSAIQAAVANLVDYSGSEDDDEVEIYPTN